MDYKSYLLDFKSLVEEDLSQQDRKSPNPTIELSSSLDENRTLKSAQVSLLYVDSPTSRVGQLNPGVNIAAKLGKNFNKGGRGILLAGQIIYPWLNQ